MKQIEELADDDLLAVWNAIGGTPHLFEYGKDELKKVLVDGQLSEENDERNDEPIEIFLDVYTMAAIVDTLRNRGFETLGIVCQQCKGYLFIEQGGESVQCPNCKGEGFEPNEKGLTEEEIKSITDMADHDFDASQAIGFAEWVSVSDWIYQRDIDRWCNGEGRKGNLLTGAQLYDKWYEQYYSVINKKS